MAPPAKLTPSLMFEISQMIRAGATSWDAAQCAGISRRTFMRWMQWGREGKSPEFVRFYGVIEKARSKAKVAHLGNITKQAKKGDWKASAWWLERMHPEEFRKISEEHVQQSVGSGEAAVFVIPANGREAPEVPDESEIEAESEDPVWDFQEGDGDGFASEEDQPGEEDPADQG